MCHVQNLGHYLEGQGHSMTLQQYRVWPITSLFEVGFLNFFTEMRGCVARKYLGHYLEDQGHSMTLQQNCVWAITLLFEVRFLIYFTEMITILRRCLERNIWVATLKVKVKA